jgi:phage terminase Nu1 subunit (DNA packaging protein)
MVRDGHLRRGDPLRVWLLAYCGRLRDQAAGRYAREASETLARARADLAIEQRDRVAIQNAQARRELAPVSVLALALARVSAQIAGILDGIPVQVRRRSPNLPANVLTLIAEEIARARNVAAAVELGDDFALEAQRLVDDGTAALMDGSRVAGDGVDDAR